MAESLSQIQSRVEAARAARDHAAWTARDAERRRVARELHDGILQDLTAVRLTLEKQSMEAPLGPLRSLSNAIGGVLASIRGVVDDLRPLDLGRRSLAEAIGGYARVVAWQRKVELHLALESAERWPDWATGDAYRIAQEAIANSVRHGSPSRISVRTWVSLQTEGPSDGFGTAAVSPTANADGRVDLSLEVEDDGCGFDVAEVALGSGVTGMRERAAALGAELEIVSSEGSGALVRLRLRVPGSDPRYV
jgi:signal transduction histidine kinase